MSKINTLRIINLKYNNNAIQINDEVFHMNGESTLLSLRNGGGKSVLVQMMTAPFVHKRYRDTKDRPFESYFTTNKPTFILVEWILDGGAGYVLTGMMVRKNQEITEEELQEELEVCQFISEYQERCEQDIFRLPVVEKTDTGMQLKSWGNCKKLLEEMKKESSHFSFYAMNQPAQSRMYFDKLKEYQIDYREWESIIKKVNLKESGLSELFADCRDEKGLVEKWFLDAVESKLNRDSSRVKEFQNIVMKYIRQYRENQTKIVRLQTIREFQEISGLLLGQCEQYLDITEKREQYEWQIGLFRLALQQLCLETEEERSQLEAALAQLEEDLRQITYEQISYQIYQKEEERDRHTQDKEQYQREKGQIEQELDQLQERRNQLECARIREDKNQALSERKRLESSLQVARQSDREKEPQRQSIGGKLRGHYLWKQKQQEEQLSQIQSRLEQLEAEQQEWKERQETDQKEQEQLHKREGELKSRILSYDRVEEEFCDRYQIALDRNILGRYEEGRLEQEEQRERQLLEETEQDRKDHYRTREETEEAIRRAERSREEAQNQRQETRVQIRELQKQQEDQEQQLEQRRTILQYLSMGQEQLYEEEKIKHQLEQKLEEIDKVRRVLEREQEQMEQICGRLRQGRLWELPADFEQFLERQGIHAVYGMDWLCKNGYSLEKNQELIRKQPFLPYSMILTAKDMDKLTDEDGEIYTDSPIPMLVREELEKELMGEDGPVYTLDHIHFYLHFCQELLSQEGRERLWNMQQAELEKKQKAIEIKREEYTSYFSKLELMRNQTVTRQRLQECREQLEQQEKKQREWEKLSQTKEEERRRLQEKIRQLEEELRILERQQERQQMMWKDFSALQKSYQAYLEDQKELERQKELADNLNRRIGKGKEELERLQKELIQTERQQMQQKSIQKEVQNQLAVFQSFEAESKEELPEEERIELEARYKALTQDLSQEIQLLEEQLSETQRRHQRHKEELERRLDRCGLTEEDLQEVVYSGETLLEVEEQITKQRDSLARWEKKINKKETEIAVLQSKIQEEYQKLEQSCGTRETAAREKITNLHFAERKQIVLLSKQQQQDQWEQLGQRKANYESNLDALSEYAWMEAEGEYSVSVHDLGQMGRSELNQHRGKLLQEYKNCQEEEIRNRELVQNRLHEMGRRESFRDEFFEKPISSLLQQVGSARDLMKQMGIVRDSYDSMVEKLEIDISVIEREKERILELLTEYIKEIHENLGRIDKNSTIQVRERNIKMLTIRLPQWEENEELYRLRVQDLLEDVTRQGLALLEENQNLEELTGLYIRTKNLYDTVVGNGNIEIRLYKIEEQKEYPIRWSDVAKNSGGEGFLSAFIVLTSLLYYMRRDETDIFADRNEGKVLVMDNPFAQTNAAHLLKPLMDMAKKTNTQLICLSGLGGDSIYNRFDNIYVMNLVAANLRTGTQYLQSEHLRGEEPETMIAAHFHVEQQTLLF